MILIPLLLCLAILPFLAKFKSNLIKRLILCIIGLSFGLIVVEFALSMGCLSDNLIWTPEKWLQYKRKMDDEITAKADRHPYKFNDTVYSPQKVPGSIRIVIIGDSFVWGEGLPDPDRWTKKFEARVKAINPSIEVLHWGKPNWSTLDEYNFVQAHLAEWEVDYLIVGFVRNDPDMHIEPAIDLNLGFGYPGDAFAPIHSVLPNLADLLGSLKRHWIYSQHPELGTENWEKRLWSAENLERYGELLIDFAALLKREKIPAFVLLCAESPNPIFRERFDKVKPYFDQAGFDVLDVYPIVAKELESVPPIALMAHRGDGHPGPLVTEIYAREAARHAQELGWTNP